MTKLKILLYSLFFIFLFFIFLGLTGSFAKGLVIAGIIIYIWGLFVADFGDY